MIILAIKSSYAYTIYILFFSLLTKKKKGAKKEMFATTYMLSLPHIVTDKHMSFSFSNELLHITGREQTFY